jgi:PAS domain S-box-containing protein
MVTGIPDSEKTTLQLLDEVQRLRLRVDELEKAFASASTINDAAVSGGITKSKKSEETLRQNLIQFRTFFDLFPFSCVVVDIDGRYVLVNKAFCLSTGYCAEYAIGRTSLELGLVKDDAGNKAVLAELAKSGEINNFEMTVAGKGGELRHILLYCRLVDSKSSPLILIVTVDITDRKQAIEALKESEHKVRAIFDLSFGFLGLLTIDGLVLEINRTALEFAGVQLSDIQGKPFWETPWWNHSPEMQQRLRAALRTAADGELARFEATHLAADGTLHTVDVSLKPVKDETGRVVLLIPEGRDITEHKLADESLRRSEEKYRSLIETTSEWIWEVDLTGKHTFSNSGVTEILGYSIEEFIGQSTVHLVHPEDLPEVQATLSRLVAEKQGWRGWTLRWRHKNGSYRYLESNANPIINAAGELVGYHGADRDITDRREAAERERCHQLELAHAARLSTMGQMATELAHELNQPLCSILTHAECALRASKSLSPQNDRLIGFIETIIKQADRAGDRVLRVKGFARKNAGARSTLYIHEVIGDAFGMVAAELNRYSIDVKLNLDRNMQPIQADPIQIEQVVVNLIQNSLDALKNVSQSKRKLTIIAEIKDDMIEVAVIDRGGGISEGNINRLFEPFFTTKSDGLGVGLSISRSIVESHRGILDFRDNSNEGVTFYFTLPINPKT